MQPNLQTTSAIDVGISEKEIWKEVGLPHWKTKLVLLQVGLF
jgi:hypothetical protein